MFFFKTIMHHLNNLTVSRLTANNEQHQPLGRTTAATKQHHNNNKWW